MTAISARWLIVATLAAAPACATADSPAAQKELELGPHRVRVSVPAGWEAQDQGAQKRFRKGEVDIVLQNLGPIGWDPALASLHDDERRQVKSRRVFKIDDHEAMEVETWNRLDHAWPLRLLFVRVDDDLIALYTPTRGDPETLRAFDAIRDSLHFAASARR